MSQTEERALRIAEKKLQIEERVNFKVAEFGYQSQFDEIKNQGFTEIKQILKALKRCKGDVSQAVEMLKNFAAKDSDELSKQNNELHQDSITGEDNQSLPKEKKWLKYLKQNHLDRINEQSKNVQEEKQPKEERKPRGERKPREERKSKEEKKSRDEKKPREKKYEKYLIRKDDEKTEEGDVEKVISERKKELNQRKRERMIEQFPLFEEFNKKMNEIGFEIEKKNFNALKKQQGDQEKAKAYLIKKRNLENLELSKTLNKNQYQRIYLDVANCFYLEPSFLRKAINGNFKEIEEQIATLMKIFQNNYGNDVDIILVFGESQLLKDTESAKHFYSTNFSLINAIPDFASSDDAIISLVGTEDAKSLESALFVTSDRSLQAQLVEKNVKNIMASKTFFNFMRDEVVGKKDYSAIVEVF